MSFIRPELARRLRRWREALVWGAVLALGIALVLRGLSPPSLHLLVPGALAALTGAALLTAALRRLAFAWEDAAAGVVEIDEGRVGYFAPRDGGFIDVRALVRVELVGKPGLRGHAWQLTAEDGERLTIPLGAVGAERLPDALSALPGLDLAAGAAALAGHRPGRVLIWAQPPARPLVRAPR